MFLPLLCYLNLIGSTEVLKYSLREINVGNNAILSSFCKLPTFFPFFFFLGTLLFFRYSGFPRGGGFGEVLSRFHT